MTRTTLVTLAFVGSAGLSVGGALQAQGRTADTTHMQGMRTGGTMDMMQQCPMMAAMAEGPEAALRHRTALTLTDAQVQRLTALRDTLRRAHQSAMAAMPALHKQLGQAAGGEQFDEQAARAALDSMAVRHTSMALAMLRTRQATQSVLTPSQRQRLATLAQSSMMRMRRGGMDMMAGGMMDGPGMGCPMMGEGMMRGGTMPGGRHGRPVPGSDSTNARHHEPR